MSLPTVAIAGATGNIGKHIVKAFLSPTFRPKFGEIIVLTRQQSSQTAAWAHQGAVVRTLGDGDMRKSLEGVDILVNAIGSPGHQLKDELLEVLPETSVKLYFPSEFGVDHTIHDFPHVEWDYKKKHAARAQALLPDDVRICRIYPGLFLEDTIGPWAGFDTQNGHYEAVGSQDTLIAFMGMDDLGMTTAAVASLPAEDIPEELHFAGDNRSFREIAKIMGDAGVGRIEVTELDLDQYKHKVLTEDPKRPAVSLRFLMGEGKIDQTESGLGNDNELINPGERNWKWKTVEDLARETKGRP